MIGTISGQLLVTMIFVRVSLLEPLAGRQDQWGNGCICSLFLFALCAALGLSHDIGSAAVTCR